MSKIEKNEQYKNLINKIANKVYSAKIESLKFIESIQIYTYWEIGKYIVEYEWISRTKLTPLPDA